MSLVVTNAVNGNYAVIGVDQDTEAGRRTVDQLNAGVFPITPDDPKISDFLKRQEGREISTQRLMFPFIP